MSTIAQRALTERWPTSGFGGIVSNGLVCALDAGVSASYSGSGTTWSNLVASPADGSAQTAWDCNVSDPLLVFTGTAGSRSPSTYFRTTGATNFSFNSIPSQAQAWHKTGAEYTMAWWAFTPTGGVSTYMYSNVNSLSSDVGVSMYDSSGALVYTVQNGVSNGTLSNISAQLGNPRDRWRFIYARMRQSSSSYVLGINGVEGTLSSSLTWGNNTSTSATAYRVWSCNIAGGKIGALYIWNRQLSQDEMVATFNATRNRWGV